MALFTNLDDGYNYCKSLSDAQNDMVVKARHLYFDNEMNGLLDNGMIIRDMSQGFLTDMAAKLDLGKNDVLKLHREAPELLAPILNKYLNTSKGKNEYLIRTYKENPLEQAVYSNEERYGRAFLSRQYKRIDNLPMLDVVAGFVNETGLEINSIYIDELGDRMSIKASTPDVRPVEVCPGDFYRIGFNFTNSEQGNGCVSLAPYLYRVVCSNGLVVQEKMTALSRIHKGMVLSPTYNLAKAESIDISLKQEVIDHLEVLSDEKSSIMSGIFDGISSSQKDLVTLNAEYFFMNVSKTYSLSFVETDCIKNAFIEEGDYTKHGLIQAITWYASHDEHLTEERSTELQSIAGSFLYTSPSVWNRLNTGD